MKPTTHPSAPRHRSVTLPRLRAAPTGAQKFTIYLGSVEIRNYSQGAAEEFLIYPHPAIRIARTKSGGTITTKISTLHRDALGSVRAVTTTAGLSAERATYRPYREQTETKFGTATATETKGFIGERFDADAGLQYLNARSYDPKLGMLLQPDWWEVTRAGVGTNRYSFGDPVNGSDPSGHDSVGYEGYYRIYPTIPQSTAQNPFVRGLDNSWRAVANAPSSAMNLFADAIYGIGDASAPYNDTLVNAAMTTPTAFDDVAAAAMRRYGQISTAAAERAALSTTSINPERLRFSQISAGGGSRDLPAMRAAMSGGSWIGEPIDVVRTASGSLVAIDNTRLALARELGFSRVPVKVHSMSETLPGDMLISERFGKSSGTWGDALKFRTSNNRLSSEGTTAVPTMPGGSTGLSGNSAGGGFMSWLRSLLGG